ncbi:sporulation protein [candidate division GN15 bacterium]|uniref:Sporulation protein n=1 Tax=candidate division GN15 bacterium TaxID=2072418 RepID=A0A855X4Q8_9BACT|nr:MAG: sporulation protein [candidate division GN15 bacterium]
MPNNTVAEILQVLVGELKQMARTESIVGEPVKAGDKTFVPVCTISVGFGAGGGSKEATSGFGGGGGAGLRIEPTAFIVMDKDGVSLLPAKRGAWENLVEAIPGAIEKLSKIKSASKSGEPDKSA